MVLEFCLCDLNFIIKNKRLNKKDLDLYEHNKWVKKSMQEILKGVKYIHQRMIMHRDLNPSNILFGLDGMLKLGDFDLARQVPLGHKKLTHEVITLYYRPPEILLGYEFYSDSVDMWSVGCIFYELAAL